MYIIYKVGRAEVFFSCIERAVITIALGRNIARFPHSTPLILHPKLCFIPLSKKKKKHSKTKQARSTKTP